MAWEKRVFTLLSPGVILRTKHPAYKRSVESVAVKFEWVYDQIIGAQRR